MRLVLDTNVVVSALIWGGNPRQILWRAMHPPHELWGSTPMLEELASVLARPKFQPMLAREGATARILESRYLTAIREVALREIAPVVASDPDDDVILATALAARAHILVTGDRRLLDLSPHGSVAILPPAAAVIRMERGIAAPR